MVTMFELMIVFFLSNPVGFVLFTGFLLYIEYLIGKNLYQNDPFLRKGIRARSKDLTRYAKGLKLALAKVRLYAGELKLKPVFLYIKAKVKKA